ncbi:MAG: M23 family metallopeptidase [Bdellovibrionaceae bacterium]|nr:M23 family metallopeptidase [Pseudobdellovibrionaceae bacterium]
MNFLFLLPILELMRTKHLFLLFFLTLALGSCSTFHTAVSRSLPAEQQVAKQRFPSSDYKFDWPVDDARLTRGFLPRARRPHLGIDLASQKGSGIFSSHRGVVIYCGRDFRGFGRMVLIEDGYGYATLYAHLERILVSEGQRVSQGEVIGTMGRTGRATGVHLHFEVRQSKKPIDPLTVLPNGEKIARLIEKQ